MKSKWSDVETLVHRYVRDEMSEREQQRFEERFLDQPEIVRKIEIAQAIRCGLAEVAAANALTERMAGPTKTDRSSWLIGLPRVHRWAAAFAMLALFSIGQFVYFGQRIDRLQAPQPNTPILLLGQVRGAADRDQLSGQLFLRDDIRWFTLELDLGWPPAPEYSLSIHSESSGELVARVDQLTASLDETLVATLPAGDFLAGRYRLEVVAGDQAVASYRLQVKRRQ